MYTKKFCNPTKKRIGRGGRFVWDYNGSSNEAELHAKLRQVMVRRLKANVLSELPPKVRTVIPVAMANKSECAAAMKELQQSSSSSSISIEQALQQEPGSQSSFNTAVMKAYQVTGVGKTQAVVDYLLDFLAGSTHDKILVFGHHKKVLDHIDQALMRHVPNTHMRIDGSVPAAVACRYWTRVAGRLPISRWAQRARSAAMP